MDSPATLFRARRRRQYHRGRLRLHRIGLPRWQVHALHEWACELDPVLGGKDWPELLRIAVELMLAQHRCPSVDVLLARNTEDALAGELEGGGRCS